MVFESNMQKFLIMPAPEFSQPLDLLSACHRRISNITEMLIKLPDYLTLHGVDNDAQLAAERALKYFDTAGQHHHDDEEQNLFPMLRTQAQQQGDVEMLALLEDLVMQHLEMDRAWQDLHSHLLKLSFKESVDPAVIPVSRFSALYRNHIHLEENFLLPYAERSLGVDQIESLGKAMAMRRGVAYPL